MTIQGHAIEWVDLAAIALLLLFFVRGCMKGFLWQLAGLFTLVGGLYVARVTSPRLGEWLRAQWPSLGATPGGEVIASFFVIFLVVMVAVYFIARLLERLVEGMKLRGTDRLLGGVLGAAKAAAFLILAVAALSLMNVESMHGALQRSKTGRIAAVAIDRGEALLPPELCERVRKVVRDVRDRFDQPGSEKDRAQPDDPHASALEKKDAPPKSGGDSGNH